MWEARGWRLDVWEAKGWRLEAGCVGGWGGRVGQGWLLGMDLGDRVNDESRSDERAKGALGQMVSPSSLGSLTDSSSQLGVH